MFAKKSHVLRPLVVAVSAGLLLAVLGCQDRKTRPAAVIKPSAVAEAPKTDPADGIGNPRSAGDGGSPTAPTVSGNDAVTDYLKPVARPARINGEDGVQRDTNAHDVFVTPVYVKGSSWFKNCVAGRIGGAQRRLFGCSHFETPRLPNEGPLKIGTSYGIPLSAGNQKFDLSFISYKPEVKPCSQIPDKQAKSTTGSCPGEMEQTPFAERASGQKSPYMLCVKSGNVLVVAFEDQTDALFEKFKTAKAGLKLEGGGSPALFPDAKKLFASEVVNAAYQDKAGKTVTEAELRSRYGVDFADVIVQIDLGTSGNTLAGFEECN
jgi:hypothetical protein